MSAGQASAVKGAENIVEVRGVRNQFGAQVVHDQLDLDVRRGEILSVVGGSGTGKSVLLRSIVGLQCTCIEGHGCPARLYDLFSRPVFLLRFLFDINERRPAASGWHIPEKIHGIFAPRFRGIGQQFFHLIRPHFRPGRGCLFVIAKEQDCRDLLRSLRTHQHHGEFQTSLLRFQTDIPDLPYGFAFWQILF